MTPSHERTQRRLQDAAMMKRRLLSPLHPFTLSPLLFFCSAAWGQAPRILDSLDMSTDPARAAHSVTLFQAVVRSDSARLGTRVLPVTGIQLSSGGHVRARLRTSLPGRDSSASHGITVMVTLATAPRDWG